MFNRNQDMTLGDIFSLTFDLLKSTFSRSLLIIATFMVPAALLMAAVMSFMLVNNGGSSTADSDSLDIIYLVIGLVFLFTLFLVVFMLYTGAWMGVTILASGELKGIRYSVSETFRRIFSVSYLKVAGQFILLLFAITGCFIIPSLLMVVHAALGVLGFIAAFILVTLLIFRWYFAAVHIVDSGEGVLASFSKSAFLVKGYWWRTFGIILLLSILVNFAVSVISTPITFIAMWDLISHSITGGSESLDPVIMSSIGFRMGILFGITYSLQLLVTPLYTIIMYYDLRIKKNDFEKETDENPLPVEEPSFDIR
jgi:hypothetical protein